MASGSGNNTAKGTNQFMRQGHTTVNAFGSNITIDAKGTAGETPKEVKP